MCLLLGFYVSSCHSACVQSVKMKKKNVVRFAQPTRLITGATLMSMLHIVTMTVDSP